MHNNADAVCSVGDDSDTAPRRPLLLSPVESEFLLRLAARAASQKTDQIKNGTSESELAVLAQRIHQRRRDRQRHFTGELFGEPAWDMLLAAYWLPTTGVELTVLGLCSESGSSKTTAWRSLERLIGLGLVRTQDGKDRRSTQVMLTRKARDRIESYLSAITASQEALAEYA